MGNNLRDLRRRIKSVKSTQQITRAMKLVAASKLRRAQENMERARPHAAGIRELLANLTRRVGPDAHALLQGRTVRRQLLVVVTADRGLAGSFNANVLRAALKHLEGTRDREVHVHAIGRKARDFFKKRPFPVRKTEVDLFRRLDFALSSALAGDLMKAFLEEGFDEVLILSNRFKTVMTQDLVLDQLLPASGQAAVAQGTAIYRTDYIYEPGPAALLDAILPRAVETQVHQVLLESYASEMGARMVAMENATSNAADMIERLTLQLNKSRQAAITTEIIEIVSGAAALEGG